jgi:ribosomal protein L37AE/L43A
MPDPTFCPKCGSIEIDDIGYDGLWECHECWSVFSDNEGAIDAIIMEEEGDLK